MIFPDAKEVKLEIFLPEQILIPSEQQSERTQIEISLHLTNSTSTPLRFDFYNARKLYPELRDASGQEYERVGIRRRVNKVFPSDLPVVKSGEKTIVLRKGKVVRYSKSSHDPPELFGLSLDARNGVIWYFRSLQLGRYQIRYIYQNDEEKINLGKYNRAGRKLGVEPVEENFWIGTVSTPLVFFDLNTF